MDLIRKIVLGNNPKDGMAYYVGMRVGDGKIVVIEFNERGYVKYGERSYRIFIETPGEGTMLWKEIVNMPTVIEYDLKF